ncbi:MAG TPA: 50S ribosomal protein L31 [Candidatus Paceibacterota bacterium]
MRKDIHPKYYASARVRCACGNTLVVGSTKEKIEVEICSACHPFFTGRKKIIDTAGRVEKFEARLAEASARQAHATKEKKNHVSKGTHKPKNKVPRK